MGRTCSPELNSALHRWLTTAQFVLTGILATVGCNLIFVSMFVFDVASCPDSYSSVNSFSCLIYLYVCAPLIVQLHLLTLIGSSHDNHNGHLLIFIVLTMAWAV